jgi:hypothetical protein
MSGRRERAFKSSAGTMDRVETVTAGGLHSEKYLYPDLARYLCAAWLAYTFGNSLATGLKMTPTDPAELGGMRHNLSKAVFDVASRSPGRAIDSDYIYSYMYINYYKRPH